MKTTVIAVGLVLLTASTSQAQIRVQQRGGFSRGGYSYNPFRILNSEYVAKDLKLTREQLKRVKQIGLQMEGARALRRPEIAKGIGVSESQLKQIVAVHDDYNKRRSEIFKMFRTNRTEAMKKYKEISAEYKTLDSKILDVLTKTQKRRFEKLKGVPFDSKKIYPPRTPVKKPNI